MTITASVSVTILPGPPSDAAEAAISFDGSRLRRLAELAAAVAELLSKFGVIPGLKATEPPASSP